MPDDTNPSPEAEARARVLWPDFDRGTFPSTWLGIIHRAQRAIDAGWTPPPDPHAEIARELFVAVFGSSANFNISINGASADLVDAVRRLDLRRGDQ